MSRRVLIISDRFYPENIAVAVRNIGFADLLINEGVDVTILTGTKFKSQYNTQYTWSPLPTNKDRFTTRFIKEIFLGIEYFVRILIKKRYTLTIVSSPPFFSSILASFALIIKNENYLFDVRDDYPQVFFSKNIISKNNIFAKFLSNLRDYVYRKSWTTSTVTKSIYNDINKVKQPLLIRNGFDKFLFKPSINKQSTFTIVFHGTLGQFQDIQLLINVAKRVYDIDDSIRFLVAGIGSKDILFNNALPPNLQYQGEVEYKAVPELLRSSHLGLSFRTDDETSKMSFPVKIYEYIGSGIPCIVTPISEAGDVVEKNKLGFSFDSNSEIEISEKICQLAINKEIYNSYVNSVVSKRDLYSRQNQLQLFIEKFEAELT